MTFAELQTWLTAHGVMMCCGFNGRTWRVRFVRYADAHKVQGVGPSLEAAWRDAADRLELTPPGRPRRFGAAKD